VRRARGAAPREGEPLALIPYLAAGQACYAFQVAEYARHFTCFTFEGCAHAPIYGDVGGFSQRALAFLRSHSG